MRIATWDEVEDEHIRLETQALNRFNVFDNEGRFMSVELDQDALTALIPDVEFSEKQVAAKMLCAFGYKPIKEIPNG